MAGPRKLRDAWGWEAPYLRLWLWVPAVLAILAAGVFYPSEGTSSLWFLLLGLLGVPFVGVFLVVGKKVRSLKASLASSEGELAESMMAIGSIEAPGVAILTETELHLVMITKRRVSVRLEEIESVRETGGIPGRILPGKKGFWLKVPGQSRIAFGVTQAVARRWAGRLRPGK